MASRSLYYTWDNMKKRCKNVKAHNYHRYGGRGIKICERWSSFKNFKEDMGKGYIKGLQLDRINNDGDYSPENCRWATRKEQAQNTSIVEKAIRITFMGETLTIRQWAEKLGIKRTTLDMRLHYGWELERALRKGGC